MLEMGGHNILQENGELEYKNQVKKDQPKKVASQNVARD